MSDIPNSVPRRPAIFLDKDGTIVCDVPYNVDPALMRWQPDTIESLRAFQEAGFALVLVTNQSGIARGMFSEAELERYLSVLRRELLYAGVLLNAIEYCPHLPEAPIPAYRKDCGCRKPKAGMLLQAASRLQLDLSRSWMIGDLLDDVEAGARGGTSRALVRHDGNEPIPGTGIRHPDIIAPTLKDAAVRIVSAAAAVA
jgi:D,D-heptose 1,7-bisphosphate phosphatase